MPSAFAVGTTVLIRLRRARSPTASYFWGQSHCRVLRTYSELIRAGCFNSWSNALFAYNVGGELEDLEPDPNNSAGGVPKCVVIDPAFTWEDDRPLNIPWNRTVIYECHVKGLTALQRLVPKALRGTYLGLASEPVITHLRGLGVTAVVSFGEPDFAELPVSRAA